MPYVSEAQRRFFHTDTARKSGISPAVVDEFDEASKGMKLPSKVKTTGTYHGKSNKLGGGGRFAQVEAKAKASGASNPAAVAAAIGRKKYGAKKFSRLSHKQI